MGREVAPGSRAVSGSALQHHALAQTLGRRRQRFTEGEGQRHLFELDAPLADELPASPAPEPEAGIDVNRPDAPMTESKPEDANILVMINANDEIWIDRRLIDPRAVRANIERLHAENPEGSVVIQANNSSTNKVLVEVMDSARQAGVYNISIADSR